MNIQYWNTTASLAGALKFATVYNDPNKKFWFYTPTFLFDTLNIL